jgi:hypothetical protein
MGAVPAQTGVILRRGKSSDILYIFHLYTTDLDARSGSKPLFQRERGGNLGPLALDGCSVQVAAIYDCHTPTSIVPVGGGRGGVTHQRFTFSLLQCLSFKFDPSTPKCPGSGNEIIPGKHSDTRIKPLPLTNGHGRYITVTTERTLVSVGE